MVDLNSGNIDVPPNMTSWPSFHNGVAAGLKIAPASQVCLKQQLHYLLIRPYSFKYMQLFAHFLLLSTRLDFHHVCYVYS